MYGQYMYNSHDDGSKAKHSSYQRLVRTVFGGNFCLLTENRQLPKWNTSLITMLNKQVLIFWLCLSIVAGLGGALLTEC